MAGRRLQPHGRRGGRAAVAARDLRRERPRRHHARRSLRVAADGRIPIRRGGERRRGRLAAARCSRGRGRQRDAGRLGGCRGSDKCFRQHALLERLQDAHVVVRDAVGPLDGGGLRGRQARTPRLLHIREWPGTVQHLHRLPGRLDDEDRLLPHGSHVHGRGRRRQYGRTRQCEQIGEQRHSGDAAVLQRVHDRRTQGLRGHSHAVAREFIQFLGHRLRDVGADLQVGLGGVSLGFSGADALWPREPAGHKQGLAALRRHARKGNREFPSRLLFRTGRQPQCDRVRLVGALRG